MLNCLIAHFSQTFCCTPQLSAISFVLLGPLCCCRLPDSIYTRVASILNILSSAMPQHEELFTNELANIMRRLSAPATQELHYLSEEAKRSMFAAATTGVGLPGLGTSQDGGTTRASVSSSSVSSGGGVAGALAVPAMGTPASPEETGPGADEGGGGVGAAGGAAFDPLNAWTGAACLRIMAAYTSFLSRKSSAQAPSSSGAASTTAGAPPAVSRGSASQARAAPPHAEAAGAPGPGPSAAAGSSGAGAAAAGPSGEGTSADGARGAQAGTAADGEGPAGAGTAGAAGAVVGAAEAGKGKGKEKAGQAQGQEESPVRIARELCVGLGPLWAVLSGCASDLERAYGDNAAFTAVAAPAAGRPAVPAPAGAASLPLPLQRLLPMVEAFFVLSEGARMTPWSINASEVAGAGAGAAASGVPRVQSSQQVSDLAAMGGDTVMTEAGSGAGAGGGGEGGVGLPAIGGRSASARELAAAAEAVLQQRAGQAGAGSDLVTLGKFLERHRRLLNAFVRVDPQLLESTMSGLRRTPWVLDLDNKRNYFRAQIRQRHESQAHYGSIRISVRRAYVLEDSYNQVGPAYISTHEVCPWQWREPLLLNVGSLSPVSENKFWLPFGVFLSVLRAGRAAAVAQPGGDAGEAERALCGRGGDRRGGAHARVVPAAVARRVRPGRAPVHHCRERGHLPAQPQLKAADGAPVLLQVCGESGEWYPFSLAFAPRSLSSASTCLRVLLLEKGAPVNLAVASANRLSFSLMGHIVSLASLRLSLAPLSVLLRFRLSI